MVLKFLAIIMATALLCTVPFIAASAEPTLHTLWDMPLNITADEFEGYIKSKLHIEFDKEVTEQGSVVFTQADRADMTLFNAPVNIMARFAKDEPHSLAYIRIDIVDDQTEAAPFSQYINIYDQLCERYGAATDARLFITNHPDADNILGALFSVLNEENSIDFQSIEQELARYPKGHNYLDIRWGNVLLSTSQKADYRAQYQYPMYIMFTPDIAVLPADKTIPFDPHPTDLSDAF